jgi:septal ring factor EnvC (AmiA/AmiB activator)
MAPIKCIVRFGVISALALGTGAVVAEWASPGSVGAMAGQAKNAITHAIDSNIENPVALRAQIRALETEYPKKIGEVRSDLNDVQEQIGQLRHQQAVSDKVVALTQADLTQLDGMIEQARGVQSQNNGVLVRVSFQRTSLDLSDAYAKRAQIEQTAKFHTERVKELTRDLGYLVQQEQQLASLRDRLETERAEFQAQLFQLDAQIDSIDRNDRLISMMEKRQKTIDEQSRYRTDSLDQLHAQLSSIRTEQQARLEAITSADHARDYETEAEYLIQQGDDGPVVLPETGFQIDPEVIEITPETLPEATKPMASRD